MDWLQRIDVKPLKVVGERLDEIITSSIEMLPNFMAALLFFAIVLLLRGAILAIAKRIFNRSKMRPALWSALRTVISTLFIVIGLLIAATIAIPGLTPAGLLAGLGVGSLAIGLAFRDTFENFLAGLLILLRKPMRIGDFIECESVEGKVEEISMRDTYVRRTDGVLVLCPNSFIFKNPTRVLTDLRERRVGITVGVAYGENVDTAREVITQAVQSVDMISTSRPPQIFAKEFGASSIDFEVVWWAGSSPLSVRESRDRVVAAVKHALDDAGIEIPFPYRTLTFNEPLTINTRSDDGASDRLMAAE